MLKLSVRAGLCAAAMTLVSACNSTDPQTQSMIDSVVTALPSEVEGCTFLGNVDTDYGSYSIQAARNHLRLKTAQLGGNHLVETHLGVSAGTVFYSRHWGGPYADPDTYLLSGRAYFCPEGKGITGPMRPAAIPLEKRPGIAEGPYRPEGHIPPVRDSSATPPAADGSLKAAPVPSDENTEVLASDSDQRPAPHGSVNPGPVKTSEYGQIIETTAYPESGALSGSPVSIGVGIGVHL